MKQYIESVTDELTGLPIGGAEVFVYDDDNNLAVLYAADGTTEIDNPLTTNEDGEFSFYGPTTELTAQVYYGGRLRRRLRLLVGGGYSVAAQTAAEAAMAAAGVGEYDDTAEGLANTSIGETFWVDQGDGTGLVYRHDSGPVATALRPFILDPTESAAATIFAGGVPTIASLAASTGTAQVGFIQSGTGAVARTAQSKARESVSLGDFMLVSGGNPRDALEKASAASRVVNIYGGTYLFDQAADVADDTTIIGHGCTIGAAASGYTDPNLINFLGSGEMAGTGFMVGANMPSPVSSWAGPGTPIGSAVFASGTSNVARAHTLKVTGWTFSGFRGGPVYGKWLDRLEVDGCAFIGNQLATLMYKASGSYVNIPTTNTLANEIVTNQNIEVYQTTEAIVTRCAVRDILSKGISLNADYVTTQGNIYVGASPRHCMEHLTGCASVIATGNQYDGGADMGDAIKTVDCEAGTIGGGAIRNSLIAIYPQDCGTLTMLPINMENVRTAYYPAHSEDATQDMAITGHVGEVLGDGSGDFLAIASHADAVTAGYGMSIRLIGGHAKNFDYGMLHKTPGLGMILDIALVGGIHFEDCTVAGVDLRARNIEFNGKFTNCNDSIAIGSTTKSVGPVVTASKRASVQAIFDGCSGAHCRVGAQALYDFQFDQISLHLEGDGGTRILAFGLDGSDSLLLFNLNVAGTEQTTVASAVYVDAGSKTVKGVFEVAIIDGSGSPNNITFEGAASLTGPFLTRVCGITGAHGMTL